MSAAALHELQRHRYDIRSNDFLRFCDDPLDDVITQLIGTVTSGSDRDRVSFRQGLTSDNIDTLLTYAQRAVVRAHRSDDVHCARSALDALALIPPTGYDFYEPWCKAALYLSTQPRGDGDLLTEWGERFVDLADPRLSDRAAITLDAMNRIHTLSQCGLIEVTTTYGPGLLFVASPLSSTSDPFGGVRGRPSIVGDFPDAYSPRSNLAQLAVSLADALEAAGETTCSPLEHDELSATIFSDVIDGGFLPVNGCLSFVADDVTTGASYTVYVAEVPDDEDVDALVDAVLLNDDQAAIARHARLVIVSAIPDFDVDFDESGDDTIVTDDEFDDEFTEVDDVEGDELEDPDELTAGEVRFATVLDIARRVLENAATL